MDERSKEWQERFEKIWDPEGQGQYRLGSPGERLVKRFLADMDPDASINEYGSGTGRAVCEMIKTPGHCRHQINMVDIALNAMEDRCRRWLDKPTLNLTFTHASLWDLPPDFPKADWGYCVDVLCFLPPEKLDAVLAEIKRTCKHFFCQVYDWDDVRLGINLTTIKGAGPWWAAKLMEYWDDVTQEVSPESAHRYIFVCKDKDVSGSLGTIDKLKDRYCGQTAWIIGRGTSLLEIKATDFGSGPIICLNESIMNISSLGLPNTLFNIWRNGDPPADLLEYLPPGTTLLLCDNPVLEDPPSSTMFKNYSPRYAFECARDINCNPRAAFSMKAAFEIAHQIFGCAEVVFVSFDACTTGDTRTVLKNTFVNSEYRPGDYDEQCQIMFARIKAIGMNTRWITPGSDVVAPWTSSNKGGGQIRLNVGCGEIIEPGYVNIDMTHPLADANMDALDLGYPNGSVDEVRSSHLLEHFAKREVPLALREWFRILKTGGKLWLNVPNLEWCMNNWIGKPEKEKNGLALDMIFGLQHHAGEYHKTGFTRSSLAQYLENAGFEDVQIEDRWSHNQQCFIATAVKKKSMKG